MRDNQVSMEVMKMKLADVKVYNMTSHNTEREIPNQFKIHANGGVYFQSYNTVIAFVKDNHVSIIRGGLDYSTTTNKWLYQFLEEEAGLWHLNKRKVSKMIESGEIETVD